MVESFGLAGLLVWVAVREFYDYKRRNRPPLQHPNPHPGANRLGDMSVAFLLQQFVEIKDGLRRIENLLRERLPK